MNFLIRAVFTIFFAAFFINTGISQTTHTWIGGSGNWSDINHWDSGMVPAASDNVIITGSGTYTVTLDLDATITDISLGGSSGRQTLSMSSRTFTINGNCTINDSGIVSISNSTLNGIGSITNHGVITATTLTVDPSFDNHGFFRISGVCNMNGALITQPNSTIQLYSLFQTPGHLISGNGFTNHGLVEYLSGYYNSNSILEIASGTLTNAPDGTIQTTRALS
jgi:hypothetical protein